MSVSSSDDEGDYMLMPEEKFVPGRRTKSPVVRRDPEDEISSDEEEAKVPALPSHPKFTLAPIAATEIGTGDPLADAQDELRQLQAEIKRPDLPLGEYQEMDQHRTELVRRIGLLQKARRAQSTADGLVSKFQQTHDLTPSAAARRLVGGK